MSKKNFTLAINTEEVENRYDLNQNGDNFILPYNGKITSDGVEFNLKNLPEELCHILYRFSELHTKKLEEDIEISSIFETVTTADFCPNFGDVLE